ncbi:FAD-binding protein [Microbacterium sp. RD1]|uniref:FAD-binding protein n=1 Tax=Microbacterium sp. RD1 TaxID=3457313 RepID=UPI003FA60013
MTANRNWAGTYTYRAPIVEARTVEDVQAVIRGGGRVRALGTRHSFTDLPDADGVLLSTAGMAGDPVLDEDARTVQVPAGMRYGDLARWLDERGWALHNLGSLPHISVAGAVVTGTHGSGSGNGVLGTAVRGIEYVSATGDLVRTTATDADFDGLVVGLGGYGVVVRLTLAVQPTYRVRQDVYAGIPWDHFLADVPAIMGAAYSVSVFTRWSGARTGDLWLKSLTEETASAVPVALADARPSDAAIVGENNLTPRGVPGPWHERLPHFRLDATPSHGDEIQSEYFVPMADAAAALSAMRLLAPLLDPVLLVSELRSIAPDGLWLSGAYDRPTLAIHFTWHNDPTGVRRVLPAIEAALAPFEARPHWAKLHGLARADLERTAPRLSDARALFERLDPDGVFTNDHLERVGIRVRR